MVQDLEKGFARANDQSKVIALSAEELQELLNRNWMTHDAMWLYNCALECGMEKANKINRAAVKAMSLIEIKRIKKAAKMESVTNIEELKKIIDFAFSVVKADFMKTKHSFIPPNMMHGEMEPGQCFAYKGLSKFGMIDQYQCGIFDRIDGWLEGLGIAFEVTPKVEGCMMHKEGKCYRDYQIFLKPE